MLNDWLGYASLRWPMQGQAAGCGVVFRFSAAVLVGSWPPTWCSMQGPLWTGPCESFLFDTVVMVSYAMQLYPLVLSFLRHQQQTLKVVSELYIVLCC